MERARKHVRFGMVVMIPRGRNGISYCHVRQLLDLASGDESHFYPPLEAHLCAT
jgi:hypothetical protein